MTSPASYNRSAVGKHWNLTDHNLMEIEGAHKPNAAHGIGGRDNEIP